MQFIHIPGAKQTAGHYSPATQAGGLICISGQLPINPHTGEKCGGSIKEQTQQVLQNIGTVLQSAGAAKEDVMKTTIYIANIALWDEVNAIYADYFGSHKPARSIVPTGSLHHGFLIEMEAMAYSKT